MRPPLANAPNSNALFPLSHIICDRGKYCQSPVILGHGVYASVSCSLLQSPAVSGHLEGPVISANFFNMSKNIAEVEIFQNGRMQTPTASPTIAYASGLVGNDLLLPFLFGRAVDTNN